MKPTVRRSYLFGVVVRGADQSEPLLVAEARRADRSPRRAKVRLQQQMSRQFPHSSDIEIINLRRIA